MPRSPYLKFPVFSVDDNDNGHQLKDKPITLLLAQACRIKIIKKGKTGLEWDMLWIVLRAWPQGNVNRVAIVGGTWATTVHVLVDGQSVIHMHVPTLSLSLSRSLLKLT